jgi:hypothetical protein
VRVEKDHIAALYFILPDIVHSPALPDHNLLNDQNLSETIKLVGFLVGYVQNNLKFLPIKVLANDSLSADWPT